MITCRFEGNDYYKKAEVDILISLASKSLMEAEQMIYIRCHEVKLFEEMGTGDICVDCVGKDGNCLNE